MKEKVKLKKAFTHHGKTYAEGEEFEGTREEIELLARQGFCDLPEENDKEQAKTSSETPKPTAHAPKK